MFTIPTLFKHEKKHLMDSVSSSCITNADEQHIIDFHHSDERVWRHRTAKILACDQFFFHKYIFFCSKVRSGLINPLPLMQSKKLYPPHIMFHPASPTVMASQIGLSWGGLGLLCSCCCLIWGLGVLQVLTWLDLKDSQRHINILYETMDRSANESLAFEKRERYIM